METQAHKANGSKLFTHCIDPTVVSFDEPRVVAKKLTAQQKRYIIN